MTSLHVLNVAKKHYRECLLGTRSFFGCGKEGHKVKDVPNIVSKGKQGKQVTPSVPMENALINRHFVYTLDKRREA